MARDHIGVWGASVTWGARDREMGGRVARLRKYMDNFSGGARVYNLGVSGAQTLDILERFEIEAKARSTNIVIFSIGINDSSLYEGKETVPLLQFADNIQQLITLAKNFTDKIVFMSMTRVDETRTCPASWGRHAFYPLAQVIKYSAKIQELCVKNEIFFLDVFDILDIEDLEDGLHPNAQGHEKIYQKVRLFMQDNHLI